MIIRYNTSRYDFLGWAQEALACEDLPSLHEYVECWPNVSLADIMAAYRSEMGRHFDSCQNIFEQFLKQEIEPRLGPLVSYQIPPIFRVHFHGFGTVSPFHCDRNFNANPDSEVLLRNRNVWVPLTKVWGNNSLWIESKVGKGDFIPIELQYGEVLIFDGMMLCHGSKANDTGSTRVSFESRVLPHRNYRSSSELELCRVS
ncbi:MAG: hypothetical protein AAGG51_20565 [Cyanobacteria bacterium P01_G01_bin.54]